MSSSSLSTPSSSRQSISISVVDKDGDLVCLELTAEHTSFKIFGRAYISLDDINISLDALEEYPISDKVIVLQGGYFDSDNGDCVQEHIYLSIEQIDSSGRLVMTARAFSPDGEDIKDHYGRGGCSNYFLNYEELGQFIRDFRAISEERARGFKFDRFRACDWA